MATYYNWFDERQGRFTRIRHEQDRVVVTLAPAHRRGAYVGVAISIAVLACLSRHLWLAPLFALDFTLVLLMALAVASIGARALRQTLSHRDNIVVMVYDHGDMRGTSTGAVFHAADIRAVEVRENTGRRQSDMAMWQTYIHVRGQEQAVLLHQRPKWRYWKERAVAEALARRWRVPLIESTTK